MTAIQNRLMQLMDEIVNICQIENLQYIVAKQTAAYLEKNDKFINSAYDFQIMMPLPDIMKLERYVKKTGLKNREFESWEDNSNLYQIVFRYVDTQSLLIDGERGEFFQKPGISVTIFALKTYKPGKVMRGCERYLQEYNKGRKRSFWIKITFGKAIERLLGENYAKKFLNVDDYQLCVNETGGVYWGGLMSLFMGKNRLARFLVRRQVKNSSNKVDSNYWCIRDDGKLISFPKDFFSNAQAVTFENRTFLIPEDVGKYLRKIYDVDEWKIKGYESMPTSKRLYVISNCNLSYREYKGSDAKAWSSIKKTMRFRTENNWWNDFIHDPLKERVDLAYEKIKRSVNQIDIWSSLKEKRADLREAYESQDIEQLKALLEDYLKKTGYYKQDDIGFYIDDEIFSYAELVWESDGKVNYAEKEYQLVPDIYKNESIDAYFAKIGKEA